jgi:hypothetical protein
MRQQVYIQQHFRRGNADSHLDCRAANYGTGGDLFVFEGTARRRERALKYPHLPRIKPQRFNGVETLRYE